MNRRPHSRAEVPKGPSGCRSKNMLKKVDEVIVLPSLEMEKPTHIQVPANKEAQLSARLLISSSFAH